LIPNLDNCVLSPMPDNMTDTTRYSEDINSKLNVTYGAEVSSLHQRKQ
jgi:hypothetical protein